VRWLIAAFVMLAAAIASFAASAPKAVGAIFLVLMVLCGVVALVIMMRFQADARKFADTVRNEQPNGVPDLEDRFRNPSQDQ
jgi:uncharacterized membrane-anchored protein